MANEGDTSHSLGTPLEQAHEIRRQRAIVELQEQVRKLAIELEQVTGSGQRNPYRHIRFLS